MDNDLFLEQMDGEAAELLLKIYCDHTVVLELGRIRKNGVALLLHIGNGQLNVVGPHCQMAVDTPTHVLVDFNLGGCEDGGIAHLHIKAKGFVQSIGQLQRLVGTGHIDAHMGHLIAQILDFIHKTGNLLSFSCPKGHNPWGHTPPHLLVHYTKLYNFMSIETLLFVRREQFFVNNAVLPPKPHG